VAKPSIESAFIQKEDLVLDPSLLNKTVLERILHLRVGECLSFLISGSEQARVAFI
jgi:hypothetical protein